MSLRSTSDQLADLCDDARLLIARTGDQEDQLEALAVSAELDVQYAEEAVLHAADLDVDRVQHLLTAQLQRSAAGAAAARRLCARVHEQHDLARRLLAALGGDRIASDQRSNAVLVVDDQSEIRQLAAHVLGRAGFVIRTAANGLEGLLAAHEMRPGVIVMDLSMPVLNGIEAMRLIKAAEATRDARVIAYTGDPLFDDSPTTRALFAAVLHKPATPADLLSTVRHVAAL